MDKELVSDGPIFDREFDAEQIYQRFARDLRINSDASKFYFRDICK